MQSESSEQLRSVVAATDTRGKHRISAELKRLEQETRFLEEELELLDKMEKASTACKETHGPTNPYWDRWFEGPQDTSGCRCWIL
ncbi:guanine nucleotide-binding protein subunit gamma 2-like isoform X2 [Nicotiana tabacum]|uniref:Guanine nucleotide-binding protein subunit gamma 2-like isoform X2 n=1 Tax=Nicotiana tabacum TaxID=4097 RepID=A0A1S3YLV8_TOBAC|nr:PREDICTED: guanine nucleotide-binding protein subunit gamma 2-like isoform X2 [Nicotiana tabacum]